jgi:hypothetical protein
MMPSKPDFNSLIPELKQWNNGDGISIDAWLQCIGSYEHAVAYGTLFWPEFTIHEDCVFFAGFGTDSFNTWMEYTQGNKRSVEAVMNHQHIIDLFPNERVQPSRDMIIYLGNLLKSMWSAKLARDFPDRDIVVDFSEEPCEDLLDYQITFCHNPQQNKPV